MVSWTNARTALKLASPTLPDASITITKSGRQLAATAVVVVLVAILEVICGAEVGSPVST